MFRRRMISGLICVLCAAVVLAAAPPWAAAAAVNHWKLYNEAASHYSKGNYERAATLLEQAVAQSKNASYYRKLAESYTQLSQFQKAANAYFAEADIHLAIAETSGDYNTYLAVLSRANALHTETVLYTSEPAAAAYKLAKFEPAQGIYVGAYIEDEKKLMKDYGKDRFKTFNEATGKQHALYFTYYRYGEPFPAQWASYVKEAGAAVKLSWQPEGGLEAVKDDKYLRQFARDAKAAGVPVFLRFASEMNGDWVSWHGNPQLYIEKFRLVSKVMKEEAPNVAMLWSPNAVPVHNINDYYPGDEWVDWVGLSMYSVRFFNGDAAQSAAHVNPLDTLDYVYKQYADRKPIMISEYGATHYSKAGDTDTTSFSIAKLSMLYNGVMLKYPRVKAINWFSMNTIERAAQADRQLNNFSLMENDRVRQAYRAIVSGDYYLSKVTDDSSGSKPFAAVSAVPANWVVYQDADDPGRTLDVYAWVKTYDPYIGKVRFELDGALAGEPRQYPFSVKLKPSSLAVGKHTLQVAVFDSAGKEASRTSQTFTVMPPLPELQPDEFLLTVGYEQVHTASGNITLQASPYVVNGTTMVPLRFVTEQLGASVQWDGATQQITVRSGATEIVLHIGGTTARIGGAEATLGAPPVLRDQLTFVPLRFVSEQMKAKVDYNGEARTIRISP